MSFSPTDSDTRKHQYHLHVVCINWRCCDEVTSKSWHRLIIQVTDLKCIWIFLQTTESNKLQLLRGWGGGRRKTITHSWLESTVFHLLEIFRKDDLPTEKKKASWNGMGYGSERLKVVNVYLSNLGTITRRYNYLNVREKQFEMYYLIDGWDLFLICRDAEGVFYKPSWLGCLLNIRSWLD